MSDSYFELTIAFTKQTKILIYQRLYLENTAGFLEEENHIKLYFPNEQKERLQNLTIKLLLLDGIPEKSLTVNQFSDKDWNDEWKQSIEPVFIKNKIIIYPSWKKHALKNTRGKILIEIDPKMSFGTGHNETTQLMLEMMCSYITKTDKTMLDFGCGTAILAIAGIKLGLKSVTAIDIDDDAIKNSKENIRRNKVNSKIKLYKSSISQIKENNFDIIAANLTSSVIIYNLRQLNKKLIPKGKLFLSGILKEEKNNISKALKEFFIIKKTFQKSKWIGYYCIKK